MDIFEMVGHHVIVVHSFRFRVHCVPTGHRSQLQNPLQRGENEEEEREGEQRGGQSGVDIHWIDLGSGRATAKSNSWFLYRLIFGERDSGRFQVGIAPS